MQRDLKDRLYEQFARIGKALANPHRIEILELLAQSDRTVESLASEIGLSIANASQHLKTLRQAALVESRKDGLHVHYRLADPGVFDLCAVIRAVAERRLADFERPGAATLRRAIGSAAGGDARSARPGESGRRRNSGRAAGARIRGGSYCRGDFDADRRPSGATSIAPD